LLMRHTDGRAVGRTWRFGATWLTPDAAMVRE
jgi:hypothetical protein